MHLSVMLFVHCLSCLLFYSSLPLPKILNYGMQLPVFIYIYIYIYYFECVSYHPLPQLVDASEILNRFCSNTNIFLYDGRDF